MLTRITDEIGTPAFPSASDFLHYSIACTSLPDDECKTVRGYYRNWADFESPRLRFWYDFQLLEINRLVQTLDAPRLLDAGCGIGTESLWFALNGASVTAIDIDDRFLSVGASRLADLERFCGRSLACTFERRSISQMEGEFDLIWLEHSFHHMEPRNEVVQKLESLLAPGGYLVFCETNAWNPLLQWQFFMLRGWQTVIKHKGEQWGNERVLTPGSLSRWFERVGLQTISTQYYRVFPAGPRFEWTLDLEKSAENPWVQKMLAPIFTHYSLVAQKTA